jgi:hypothetical protein
VAALAVALRESSKNLLGPSGAGESIAVKRQTHAVEPGVRLLCMITDEMKLRLGEFYMNFSWLDEETAAAVGMFSMKSPWRPLAVEVAMTCTFGQKLSRLKQHLESTDWSRVLGSDKFVNPLIDWHGRAYRLNDDRVALTHGLFDVSYKTGQHFFHHLRTDRKIPAEPNLIKGLTETCIQLHIDLMRELTVARRIGLPKGLFIKDNADPQQD